MSVKLAIEGGSPIRDKFLPFAKPYIEEQEIAEVVDTLKSGWLTTGPKTKKFEENFKEFVQAKYAIATNSCTSALHLALIGAGVKEGDEVITTPITFPSTIHVIIYQRAKPVFADVKEDTLNIDPKELEKKINNKTRAIIPVHIAGLPCDMDEISEIATHYNSVVIEDAAHAINSIYKGKKIGSISPFSAFSFYAIKNLTTGEGGMLTINDDSYYDDLRIKGYCGITSDAWQRYGPKGFKKWITTHLGYKYNMSDIMASIGLVQLAKIDKIQQKRDLLSKYYRQLLRDFELISLPPIYTDRKSSNHLFIIKLNLEMLTKDRDFVLSALQAENIGVGLHFEALHLHPYFRKNFGFKEGLLPVAEKMSKRIISLPLYPLMTERDVEDVVKALDKVLGHIKR